MGKGDSDGGGAEERVAEKRGTRPILYLKAEGRALDYREGKK